MTNALFGWRNHVTTASLTGSGGVPFLDVGNLRNEQGSPALGWQMPGTVAALVADTHAAASTWRAFVLARTNLTAAATVQWRVGPAAACFGTGGEFSYDSGVIPAGVAPGFGQSVHVAPAPVAGEAVRLDIADPGNPDGFINVPLAYAGPVWQPATNIAYDTSLGRDDATDETTTRGGAEFPTLQWTRRRWDVSLQGIRASELWPSVMELDRAARTSQNVLFVPDPAGADVAREAVFGRLRSLGDVTYPFGNGDRRAWRARITERL